MAAPTNISAATATEITSLPTTIVQDVSEAAGPLYEVWFKYTGRSGDALAIGAWASTPAASNYETEVSVYTGTPSSLTLITNFSFIYRVPFEPPAVEGTNYFFQVTQIGAGVPDSDLTFSLVQGPRSGSPIGSILITDFGSDVPALTVSAEDGEILQFINIPASDFGDTLPNGVMAFINGDSPYVVSLYEPTTLDLIVAQAGLTLGGNFNQIRSNGSDTFYVGKSTSGADAIISTISDAGVVGGTTWTLPANSRSLRAMTVAKDDSILYYGNTATSIVRQYDLVGSAPLADLVAAVAGYTLKKDMLVMTDGTLLVAYDGAVDRVLHYSAAGALLHTYLFTGYSLDRIALALDDPLSFWAWSFVTSGGNTVSRFDNILIADGSVITTFDVPLFANGIAFGEAVADSMSRFGVSNSCPLLLLYALVPAPPIPLSGIYYLEIDKRHDTLYLTHSPVTTDNYEIPNPFAKTAYIGDE